MTYQELLDEFCKRRANPPFVVVRNNITQKDLYGMIEDIQWAMQALLEKLRDEREGPK